MNNESRGKSKASFRRTPRDIEILSLAAKWPFVTAEDVRIKFYEGKRTKNHFTRLKKLTAAGHLDHVMGDSGARLAFRITRKGIRLIPDESLRSKAMSARRAHYRTGFDHDRVLLRIQEVLELSPLVSRFMPENEVRQLLVSRHGRPEQQHQGFKVPDGLFQLTTARVSMTVAIELELSVKKASAYCRIFREQMLSADYESVLYVVRSDRMKTLLSHLLKEVQEKDLLVTTAARRNALYFIVLDDLLEKRLDALFEGEANSFSLTSLASADPAPP